MTEETDFTATCASRSGLSGPHGKFDHEVKTLLDEETYNKLLQKCARLGKLPGPLMRDLAYLFVHGMTPAEVVAKHNREMLEGEGPNKGIALRVEEMSATFAGRAQ